jgi:chromate reductase
MRVLAISGSLRRDSHNTSLLQAAAAELPHGAELELYAELGEIPPYNEDSASVPASVERLREAIRSADAVLISTPEYNHSIPGVLKNALDWASRPFPDSSLRAKPAAVLGASTGSFGAVWAQAELRKVLGATGARVIDEELPVGIAAEAFAEDGRLRDEKLRARLGAIVGKLAREAGATIAAAA